MNYLHVGCDTLDKDKHINIKNGEIKPIGGLWATIQDDDFEYNTWVEYMSHNIYLLFYKNEDPFIKPALLFNLKSNANIYYLNDSNSLMYLLKYFNINDWIDFEKLSSFYDGIYIDLNILKEDITDDEKYKLSKFAVSSLILFNIDCINSYTKSKVIIEPFDYEFYKFFTKYSIEISDDITLKRTIE